MCEKCLPAREIAAKIAENMNVQECCSAEKSRNFYRKQGVVAERERIIKLLEEHEAKLEGRSNLVSFAFLYALIKGEQNA